MKQLLLFSLVICLLVIPNVTEAQPIFVVKKSQPVPGDSTSGVYYGKLVAYEDCKDLEDVPKECIGTGEALRVLDMDNGWFMAVYPALAIEIDEFYAQNSSLSSIQLGEESEWIHNADVAMFFFESEQWGYAKIKRGSIEMVYTTLPKKKLTLYFHDLFMSDDN